MLALVGFSGFSISPGGQYMHNGACFGQMHRPVPPDSHLRTSIWSTCIGGEQNIYLRSHLGTCLQSHHRSCEPCSCGERSSCLIFLTFSTRPVPTTQ